MEGRARDLTAARNTPAPFISPIVTNRPALARRSSRLRIVLLNAAGGAQLAVIEACLRRPPLDDADVILLCEADRGIRRSGVRDVSGDLAASLGMSCAYVPEYKVGRDGLAFMGNAILSSAPFEDVEAVAMPSAFTHVMSRQMKRYSYTGMPTGILATAKFGGEKLTIGLAHLHSRCTPAERERQLAAYMAAFPATGRAIFGGDLNTTTTDLLSASSVARLGAAMLLNSRRFRSPVRHEPLFDRMRERELRIEGANADNRGTFTFSGIIPRVFRPKLDWLALRDLRPLPRTARVVPPRLSIFSRRASDHDFIAVDVAL
ncbi:MAG: hypothetical protein Q7S58_06000 [Candidatus Binatus sp.]|uniref:endonuclease/exonuclease/phosphatase family protein n=1 Tax=Candidatus Binatus sp. TaxID=2811406 RepID=UPI002720CF88|nr:endonuclease/exonuclease/phosphatase family protein [Candidatus Binatus sp.]MDO8431949.1 hypothetical protein [Candidatus Binatus sp.]